MEEHIKQPILIGAIACSSFVMIYQFVYYFTLPRGENFTTLGILSGIGLGILIGGIAGGVMFAVMRNRM